jgi:hypothetical protein
MYWADLSRLSGAIPRILTEFGTLIFRLSRLGRDTVDEGRAFLRGQRGATPAWTLLAALQSAIDWLFVNVLAQLFFHLFLFGGALVVLGLARPVVPEHRVHFGVAVALAVLGRCCSLPAWRPLANEGAAADDAGAGRRLASRRGRRGGGHGRRPARARQRGLRLGAAGRRPALSRSSATSASPSGPRLLAFVLVHRFGSLGGATANLDAWRGAALYGSELALVAIKWFWIAMAPLLLAWVVTGGYVQYPSAGRAATRAAPASSPADSASGSRSAPSSS